MIVKKVGGVLLLKLKLYKLIKILTLPLIIISLVLPFTQWNFINSRQKYEFQEPSLRTKIFDLNYEKQNIRNEITYSEISEGIKTVSFQGRLNNQCILITFPESFSQSQAIKILYQTIKNDKNLAKNVVLFSYQNSKVLKDLFQKYQSGQKSINFGTIRVALNIDSQIRNKQKSKSNEFKAFLQIFGKSGVRSDVDNFQSIKQLLQRLHIQQSPCQEIYQIDFLKIIRKSLSYLNPYFPGSKSRLLTFTEHLLCQGYKTFLNDYQKSHEILMEYGFQSSSITFLTNEMASESDKKLQNSQKIAKLSYSFIKQYSIQQDHLHSSSTFYYPISKHYYISIMGTIYGGLIFFIVGLINVVGYIVQNSQNLNSKVTMFNLIEIFLFSLEFKITGNINKSLLYLLIKSFIKIFIAITPFSKKKKQQITSMEFALLTGVSFLISFYFTIFNFSLFYLSALSSCLMLTKNKKSIFVFLVLIIIWTNFGLNFDTIKSQIQGLSLSDLQPIAKNLIEKIVNLIQKISFEAKITILPLIYGYSTFLN